MGAPQAIVAILTANSGVTALVGARIWPELAPTENATYPRIIYEMSDGEFPIASDGPVGIGFKRCKVYCQGLSPADRGALSSAVLSALNGAKGTYAGTIVQGVFLEDDNDSDIPLGETGQAFVVYENAMEFSMAFNY